MAPSVVWFRRDLRVEDHPALDAATAHGDVVALFVLDPGLFGPAHRRRRDQLLGYLGALDAGLRERGGRLHVVEGDPAEQVPAVVARVGADRVVVDVDATPYSRRRDDRVEAVLDVPLERHWGTLVQPPLSVLTGKGTLSRVFTPFYKRWVVADRPEWPVPGGGTVLSIDGLGVELPRPEAEVPLDPSVGAVEARVDGFFDRAASYGDERDRLDLVGTSGLSVDLHYGSVSPAALAERGSEHPDAEPFVRQLAWRDWYSHLLWEHPDLPDRALQPGYDEIEWRNDPDEFAAWCEGRTGYPVVDAAMRQLHETGIVHNRARMIVGSFLVKDLLVDWREGERFYRHHLLDGDVANNAGNWQWVAGTGADAAPYFRIFNPITQSQKFDPTGAYLRRFLPELAGLDGTALHFPAAAGPLDLAAAGVTLGETYPEPIVDHSAARDRCLATYKAAVKKD